MVIAYNAVSSRKKQCLSEFNTSSTQLVIIKFMETYAVSEQPILFAIAT